MYHKSKMQLRHWHQRIFDEQNLDVGAMHFSPPDVDRRKINVVLVYFLMQLR